MGLNKGIIMIAIYAVFTTGALGFFINNMFKGRGMDKTIEDLEDQIVLLQEERMQLKEEVDQLELQTNRLGSETSRLAVLNIELEENLSDLNATVVSFSKLTPELNVSLASYDESNKMLQEILTEATRVNNVLNNTVVILEEEVIHLHTINSELAGIVIENEEQSNDLSKVLDDLVATNQNMMIQGEEFDKTVIELETQNMELINSNNDLRASIVFLDQAGINMNASSQAFFDYLVDEIDSNTELVLRSLELSYQDTYSFWTCIGLFDDIFKEEDWVVDAYRPIGESGYTSIMNYIDTYVLTKICANRSDFELYLSNDLVFGYDGSVPNTNITYSALLSGIERYSTELVDYHFSFQNDGLNKTDWILADFDCRHLPAEKIFRWQQR